MRSILVIALGLALLCVARPSRAQGAYAGDGIAPSSIPPVAAEADLEERLGRAIDGSLAFTDERGRAVRLADYLGDGKPVVLVMAYFRCPMLCGLVLRGVVEGMNALGWSPGEKYRALTVSFDPRDDAPAARQKQASTLAALAAPAPEEAWHFLTGPEASSRALADAIGFRYGYDARSDQYAHPAVVVVLAPDGRITRYLYGVDVKARDLRLALLEASEGRVGSIADRVLVTCYRYDPATRRYGPYVFGFMRLGAGAILATVGVLLFALWRGERRRRARREDPR